MIQRVKRIISEKAGSIKNLASVIGVSENKIENYSCGKSKISVEFLTSILAAYPDISAEWLLRGTGSMLCSETRTSCSETRSEVTNVNINRSHAKNIATGSSTITEAPATDQTSLIAQLIQQNTTLLNMLQSKQS